MANYTPNLNLRKPLTTEKYDVVADLNDTKDKIDTHAGAVNAQLAQKATSIKKYGALGNAKYYDAVTDSYYTDSSMATLAHDDTIAIQQAINENDYVFIPQGQYLITTPITGKTGLHLYGVNRFKSKIIAQGCDGLVFNGDLYYFNLKDFSIHGSNPDMYTNKGLVINNGGAKYKVDNLNIQYFDIGIDLYSAYLAEYYSPFIQYCNTGIKLSGPSNGFGVHAHSFYGGEACNVKIGLSAKYGNATKFYGTTFEQCSEYGVWFESGNELRNFKLDTIYFEANKVDIGAPTLSNVRITNCFMTSVGKPVDGKFIATDNLFRCKIENNVFSASPTGNHIDRLNAGAATLVVDVIIAGNDVIDGTPLKISADFKSLITAQGATSSNVVQGSNDMIVHRASKSPHLFIGCRLFHSVAQTIESGVTTTLAFDSESYDTDGMHSPTVLNNRITMQTAGKYRITAQISWAINPTGKRVVYLRKNEAVLIGLTSMNAVSMAGSSSIQTVSVIYDFAVGEYVEVQVAQDSGGQLSVNRSADFSAIFSAEKVG